MIENQSSDPKDLNTFSQEKLSGMTEPEKDLSPEKEKKGKIFLWIFLAGLFLGFLFFLCFRADRLFFIRETKETSKENISFRSSSLPDLLIGSVMEKEKVSPEPLEEPAKTLDPLFLEEEDREVFIEPEIQQTEEKKEILKQEEKEILQETPLDFPEIDPFEDFVKEIEKPVEEEKKEADLTEKDMPKLPSTGKSGKNLFR